MNEELFRKQKELETLERIKQEYNKDPIKAMLKNAEIEVELEEIKRKVRKLAPEIQREILGAEKNRTIDLSRD